MEDRKQLEVSAIQSGTVIDHIASEHTFHVANILRLDDEPDTVLVAMNLVSGRLAKKGIIKIEGKFLTQEMVNKIALISPRATLNIIENYTVAKKIRVEVPDVIEGILRCYNPSCVTNVTSHGATPRTKFYAESKQPVRLRCHHCERVMNYTEMELL